MMLKNGGKCRY